MRNKEIIFTPNKARVLVSFVLFLLIFVIGIVLTKNDNSTSAHIILITPIIPLIYSILSLIFKTNYIKITNDKLIIRHGFAIHKLDWECIKCFYPLTVPAGIDITQQAVCIELKPKYIKSIKWGLKIFSKPYGYENYELCKILNSYL